MIAENLQILRKRITEVCSRCGRSAEEIQLLAVSKTFSVDAIREAMAAGQKEFGENYVQELREKREAFSDADVRWHFIGHLQSNKVKYLSEYVHLIHSVDDLELGKEIDKRAAKAGRIQNVLVEVHTTDEATKYGVAPEQTMALVKGLAVLPNVRLRGLMTMGPFADDPNQSRSSFRQVMELKQQIEREGIDHVEMQQLSMGMTHDFEIAIEEGATIVRIGTAIFGTRSYNNS
ncbi:MAG TPA: YggS family pyridoxal phosphate-dependent enzyme [Bacteroidota bacterium]|nr:YggS family pyridoxal phosphate-dependent enzyme [Bacteroidota bacterium]